MMQPEIETREIARTGIRVTPIAMGCWPIVGITSIDVSEAASRATLKMAFERGINFFDTAYCYGYEGESERMIGETLGSHRDEIVIATKCGIHWGHDRKQVRDARPETIHRQCRESLSRLGTDHVELLYLHAPDPQTPVEESAAALRQIQEAGLARCIGVSNFTTAQLEAFHKVCPIAAFQPHYNMLQREIETSQLPWCIEQGVSTMVYWPLMKGLLAGKLPRDHVFAEQDGRRKYPMFQGEEWEKNQDFLDTLRQIAAEANRTVAQLVLNWTILQQGITVALCGAKRPAQIEDNAATLTWKLTQEQLAQLTAAITARGPTVSRGAVT